MTIINYRTWGIALAICVIVVSLTPVTFADTTKIDQSTPIADLKIQANKGNSAAMLELGERLLQGQGVDTNAVEGLDWIKKSAETGNAGAYLDLGMVYSNAIGVELNIPEAMKYYRKGADLGNADCQASLGLFYQAGERIPGGVKADNVEALKWYRLAAAQNHQEAIFHLAQLLLRGDGIKPDTAEAINLLRKGAESGNPDAQWILGNCYKKGVGVEKDPVQAYALIFAAVDGCENPEQKKGMGEICDTLRTTLNPEQLKQAQKLTQVWISKRNR